jgi:hypothetical protein
MNEAKALAWNMPYGQSIHFLFFVIVASYEDYTFMGQIKEEIQAAYRRI